MQGKPPETLQPNNGIQYFILVVRRQMPVVGYNIFNTVIGLVIDRHSHLLIAEDVTWTYWIAGLPIQDHPPQYNLDHQLHSEVSYAILLHTPPLKCLLVP